jgi:sulfite exporter TauE/SafE
MTTLLAAILAASLLGSTHCAGMCGAFVLFALGESTTPKQHAVRQLAYHLGRLLTYTLFGALAGAMGTALNAGGDHLGLSQLAAGIAGVTMVTMGIITLLRVKGVRISRLALPPVFQQNLIRAHRSIGEWTPTSRAFATGLLTTLLPCGWLYAFVIIAAGTGHWWSGAASMFVFWLGTVPLLALMGTSIQKLAAPVRKRLPIVSAIALIALGSFTAIGRVTLPVGSMLDAIGPIPGSTGEAIARVHATTSSNVPCCDASVLSVKECSK